MNSINPNHPMSAFANENAVKFIACMIWKLRAHCPNLSIELTMEDMSELATVFMSGGQEAVVACFGKADRVILQLIDRATGETLLTPENDENSPNAKMMARARDARKRAPGVADRLVQFRNVNDQALMREAAEILKLLTWEPTS